jgi:MFS family permease
VTRPWYAQTRWWVAILLCAVTMIGYIDRLALAVAGPVIRREFAFTNEQYGLITSAFLLSYALGQLLIGPVVDRLGSKRALSLAVLWWSVASMLHAVCRGVGSFFAARAFLGVTESANFPTAYKVIAEWFPRAERSFASGFVTAGTGIGAIVAPPLIAFSLPRSMRCMPRVCRPRAAGRRLSSFPGSWDSHGYGCGSVASTCRNRTRPSMPRSAL